MGPMRLGPHAMVTRTQMLCKEWPELLRVLWREQHPEAHEQTILNFAVKPVSLKLVPLFPEPGANATLRTGSHSPVLWQCKISGSSRVDRLARNVHFISGLSYAKGGNVL
jgi:hypothetical protein